MHRISGSRSPAFASSTIVWFLFRLFRYVALALLVGTALGAGMVLQAPTSRPLPGANGLVAARRRAWMRLRWRLAAYRTIDGNAGATLARTSVLSKSGSGLPWRDQIPGAHSVGELEHRDLFSALVAEWRAAVPPLPPAATNVRRAQVRRGPMPTTPSIQPST
jgi:hypothetical protein